jgi:hypothetical protein
MYSKHSGMHWRASVTMWFRQASACFDWFGSAKSDNYFVSEYFIQIS